MVLEARLDRLQQTARRYPVRRCCCIRAWHGAYAIPCRNGFVRARFCRYTHYTATGAQALVRSSPKLAAQPEFQALSNLRGVDVVAVRLFFKERLDMPRAASVAGGGMAPGKKHAGSWCETALADLTACRPCYARHLMQHHRWSFIPPSLPAASTFQSYAVLSTDNLEGLAVFFCILAACSS